MRHVVGGCVLYHHLLVGDIGVGAESGDDIIAHLGLVVYGLGEDGAVLGGAAAHHDSVELSGLDVFDILRLGHAPGGDSPGAGIRKEYTVVGIRGLVGKYAVGIYEGEYLITVFHSLDLDQRAPEVSGKTGGDASLDLRFGHHLGGDGRIVRSAEYVGVDDILVVDVGRLVLVRGGVIGLKTELRHAVVGTYAEVRASYIDPLAKLVIAVKRRLAKLEVDATGGILKVDFAVKIAGLIVGDHLAFYPDVFSDGVAGCHLPLKRSFLLVLALHGLNGSEGAGESVLGEVGLGPYLHLGGFIVAEGEYGLPFFFQTLAGNKGGKRRNCIN